MPESYTYIHLPVKYVFAIFWRPWRGSECPPCPPSPTPMVLRMFYVNRVMLPSDVID